MTSLIFQDLRVLGVRGFWLYDGYNSKISAEIMLDMVIYQVSNNIRIFPSIVYMIVCILVFPSLFNDSMSHPEQI